MDNIIELHLSSDTGFDRSEGRKSNILFNLQKHITLRRNICSVALYSGSVPHSFYPISSLNDTFILTVDGTPYTCNLSHGSYNAIQLVDLFVSLANVATGMLWSGAYDRNSKKMKFVASAGAVSTVTLSFEGTTSKVLGFSDTTHNAILAGGDFSLTSDNVVNVNGALSLDIRIEGMTFIDAMTPSGSSDILRRLYLTTNGDGIEVMQPSGSVDWKGAVLANSNINSIGILMTDRFGRVFDFNGVDWELTLWIQIV